MNAIIYTTNTGSTERYARLLAQETGLPAYSSAQAKKAVPANGEVIYLGWIMAGSVKGYAAAAKRYQVRAVCSVGMDADGQCAGKDGGPRPYSGIHPARQFRRQEAARRLPAHHGDHGENGG